MNAIEIGLSLWSLGFVLAGIAFFIEGQKFNNYLKRQHHEKWLSMTEDLPIYKMIWPFTKGPLPYFIYKSKDDLGDQEVLRRKKKLNRSFYIFSTFPALFILFVIIFFWYLSSIQPGQMKFKWFFQ